MARKMIRRSSLCCTTGCPKLDARAEANVEVSPLRHWLDEHAGQPEVGWCEWRLPTLDRLVRDAIIVGQCPNQATPAALYRFRKLVGHVADGELNPNRMHEFWHVVGTSMASQGDYMKLQQFNWWGWYRHHDPDRVHETPEALALKDEVNEWMD